MNIWLIEPYYTGSHRAWADGYQAHSRHAVRLLTLPGRFWKWRMQGGAVTLARKAQAVDERPDAILASDMLNLPAFLTLSGGGLADVPVALYFHENQLTYPLQPGEKRDLHYGFINVVSALRAEALFFNSAYHLEAFFDELPRLLKHFPDYNELWTVDALRARAQVLPLGMDLARFDAHRGEAPDADRPLILWNHRWEYDKDPETFFRVVYALADEVPEDGAPKAGAPQERAPQEGGADFGLVLLGESFRNQPEEFLEVRQRLPDRIFHFGYAEDAETYSRLLWQADIVVSTAQHEFFGAAIVEACYCDCFPVLPRRLSYPELIPATHHRACLYEDFNGLLARLRHALRHVAEVREFSLQQHMAQFDWGQMAPRYDRLLEQTAMRGARGAMRVTA
jgi:glycosyltransferase involved in cell wall biosynthesis